MTTTQSVEGVRLGLTRLREAAKRDKRLRFNNLLHHVTVASLEAAYRHLNRRAAKGIDNESWASYGNGLLAKLELLCDRLHRNQYRPLPVKRIWITKDNGQQRPIGITAIEDKIVQQAVVDILEAIYETEFKGFSYGFRPGRSPHHALDAIYMALTVKKVSWVLDADIKGFFDTIDHGWMMKFLGHRIADPRLLRIIERMLKSEVDEEGRRTKSEVGTPQGAVISPLLGNIYLHYVLDSWAQRWRSREARGEMIIVRYADDTVFGFQYRTDAEQFGKAQRERLAQFGLALNEEKTRLIEFGRFASSNRKQRGEEKPETFDFLGFTHICAQRRSDGGYTVRRITIAKKQRNTLQKIKAHLVRIRQQSVSLQGSWLRKVMLGHNNYFGVPGNRTALNAFRANICRAWIKSLRRRSQKGAELSWLRFRKVIQLFIPSVRIVHPYPNARLRV